MQALLTARQIQFGQEAHLTAEHAALAGRQGRQGEAGEASRALRQQDVLQLELFITFAVIDAEVVNTTATTMRKLPQSWNVL